ncbi:MAG: hypothetical protein J1F36_04930 [Clostridiales bacterium]|nr:hypothetical protein [Clostridiales bacterium]
MKKILSLSMLIVGTIIGAGFASGKEISSFFGSNISPLVAPLVGLGIFLLCYLFCTIGRVFSSRDFGEVNQKLLGKLHVIADAFLLLNSLIVLSGMLSGMDSLFNSIFPIAPAYSIISGVLCAIIVAKGLKGLLKGNSIIVPFIILFIVLICCFNIGQPNFSFAFKPFTVPAIIIYVCMNIMLACTVLTTVDEKPKTVFWASLIAALIMTALMLLIILTLNGSETNSEMPLITIASSTSKVLYYVAVAAVATSIFTTMMTALSGLSGWLTPLTGNKHFAVAVSLIAGLIVSNLGFENVVAYLYPVIGLVGLIYVILCAYFLAKKSFAFKKPFGKRNRKVHDGGEKA